MNSTETVTTPVRHACAVIVSEENLWEVSAGYLADGLASGERVLYFEDRTAERVLERLADDGVATDDVIVSGQLSIGSQELTRAMLSGPVARLEEVVLAAVDESLALGYPGVRLTGDFSHAARRIGGVGPVEYDRGLQRVLDQRSGARLLCLHDLRRFPSELICELRAVHDQEICFPSVYDDGLLRITRPAVGALRMAGEADYSNRGILDRLLATVLDETLRSPSGPSAVTVDVTSLRFLDVAGAMVFVRAADRFPTSHRLLLLGTRPRVHRVLERTGALSAPLLDVVARAEPRAGHHDNTQGREVAAAQRA